MERRNMEQSPENTGGSRDGLGRFKPGCSGNPDGKPPGSISVIAQVKKKLLEMPIGEQKTYLDMLIDQIFKSAIIDGDPQMIKEIWHYIDGLPKQEFISERDHPPVALVQFVSSDDKISDSGVDKSDDENYN
jgi:hypothetical protein